MRRGGLPAGRSVFRRVILVAAVAYLGIRFGLPWVSVLVGASLTPAPVPVFTLRMYAVCIAVGTLVYVASDQARLTAFLTPAVRLFDLRGGQRRPVQVAALAVIPLAIGVLAWRRFIPRPETPLVFRIQHPGMPQQFIARENPFAHLEGEERADVVREGTVIYQTNCRPCHGATGQGNGPLSRGLRLKPVDFTDPGTIATVVEQYVYWRVSEGGAGLPTIGTPWNSAMPSWANDLDEDEIWKVIMAAYDLAGTAPRQPEGRE